MSLIPWRPFSDLDKFFEGEDWLLPVFPNYGSMPAMDVYETDTDVVAEMNAPGIDPEKLKISVKDGVLRISGSSEEQKEDKQKGYMRREIRRGSFERAVQLPAAVKEDSVEATYGKGILKISMPKAAAKELPTIKVKVLDTK